jgi:hypothetical protein
MDKGDVATIATVSDNPIDDLPDLLLHFWDLRRQSVAVLGRTWQGFNVSYKLTVSRAMQ